MNVILSQRRRLFVVCFAVVAATGLVFQNCSKVGFTNQGSESSQIAADAPVNLQSQTVNVAAHNVPPLKIFFVIDNSYTMLKNQLNLASSFQALFAGQSGKSLADFAVTAYLINTAQRSPDWNSVELSAIATLQNAPPAPSPNGAFTTARTAAGNSGSLPGDNEGFSLALSGTSALFNPATVMGLVANPGGTVTAQIGITKLAGQTATDMASEFQKRLAVLNSSRVPLNADGTQQFHDILDQESGLCALARVLRNNANFVQPGDQAAFVIVSDEDENDPAGAACVQSYNNLTLADELIRGTCEERTSTLSYTVNTTAADSCKVSYNYGYVYKYLWTQSVAATQIAYRKVTNTGTYSQPQTKLSYATQTTTFTNVATKVTYYLKTTKPVIADGIVVGQNVSYAPASGTAKGDVTGTCAAAAKLLNAAAVVDDPNHAVACVRADQATGACATNDTNCRTTTSTAATAKVIDGTYADPASCLAQAKLIAGAVVDGSQPVTCTATTARTGSGACTAAMTALGCAVATAPVYATVNVTVSGDFTAAANCAAKAAGQASAAIDATHPATCTATTVAQTSTATGTLAFTASTADGGSTLPLGDCGSLGSTIFNNVRAANAAAVAGGTCTLTGYQSSAVALAPTSGGCASQAASTCSGSAGAKRACAGVTVAGAAGSAKTTLPAVTREVSCGEPCALANNQYCASGSGVTVTATMTINDYLKARYGATTTCNVNVSAATVSSFADRKIGDKALLCVGTAAKPQYLVQSGTSYHLQQLVTDYVAGTANAQPAQGLLNYVEGRSAQLFGTTKPIVSVFVRTAQDGTGQGGSIGTTYKAFADAMGGATQSVLSSDYSPALQTLGSVIQERLDRSFTVPTMTPTQIVDSVQIQAFGQSTWTTLQKNQWSISGTTVTLVNGVPLGENDQLRFNFY